MAGSPFEGKSEPRSAWGGYASFSGVVFAARSADLAIASILPPPLVSTPNRGDPPPLLFFAGEMSSGGAYLGDFDFPSGLRYREVGAMIPCVEHSCCDGPVVFVYRMYADHALPVSIGNTVYGLRKEVALTSWDGERYEARRGDRVCFGCAGTIDGAWSKCLPANQATRWLSRAVERPIVGMRASGRFVELHFEWGFGHAEACGFSGEGELYFEEARRSLRFVSVEHAAFAVRGMEFRTTPPRELSPP